MRVSLARRRYQAAHTVGAVSTTFYLLQKTEETRKLLFFYAFKIFAGKGHASA